MNEEDAVKLSQQQFGREAEKYVSSVIHASDKDLQFITNFIKPHQDWTVLDIATGTGHLALALAPYVNKVIASDITPEMLNEADKLARQRNYINVTTEKFDVHEIPHNNDSFNLVTSRIAPHHFFDIKKAVAEMVRVCKPGAFVFIQDTIAPEDQDAAEIFNEIEKLRDPSHIRDLSISEWIELLEGKNCRILRQDSKSKDWPLKWWTDRMSTPKGNIIKILEILNNCYEEYKDMIHIRKAEGFNRDTVEQELLFWSLHPHNGYFLAQKLR